MLAAITAGGRVAGPLADAMGTDVKALAPFGDATLVDRAVAAARAAGASTVAVVGGAAIRAHCRDRVDEVIEESSEGRENLRRAIERARDERLLLITSDLPFVTADGLRDFVRRAAPFELALPLASEADYVARYPGAPDHITAIGGIRVANGSVAYFAPGVAPRALDAAQRMFDARKSLLRMAALLGPRLLARFVLRRLTVGDIEARARTVLGVDARAVFEADPGLCYDVDTLADYHYALAHAAG